MNIPRPKYRGAGHLSAPALATSTGRQPIEENVGGLDNQRASSGVSSTSDVALAQDTKLTGSRQVASSPEALASIFARPDGGGLVNLVEATAIAWFVAGVALLRSGIDAREFRASWTNSAALRRSYRTYPKTERIDAGVLLWDAHRG